MTAQTTDAAVGWLRARRGHRFFLFVQVNADAAESTVTQLVTALKNRGLYDQATIVLTADSGETGAGMSLDDTSLHVPLIVKQPDGEGAGRRVAVPVQHIDILPTVLDLVRAPVPSGLRGRSLRAVLGGDETDVADRPIYAESLAGRFRFGGPGKFALASPAHRYVRGGSREELVVLEGGGVASAPPEATETVELRAELDRLLEGRPVDPPAEIAAADEGPLPPPWGTSAERRLWARRACRWSRTEEWVVETHRTAATLAGRREQGGD